MLKQGSFPGSGANISDLDDSAAREFQTQAGLIVAYALLSLVHNNPQSHLWLPRPGIEPWPLTCEASIIPLRHLANHFELGKIIVELNRKKVFKAKVKWI